MPNWCENQVRISGPVDKIYDMAKAMEREELLEHLVPVEGNILLTLRLLDIYFFFSYLC